MEAHHEGVGDSHPTALAVRLHIVFLVADIEHHLLGIRSLQVEISSALFVEFGELIARHGGLSDESIGRHLYFLDCRFHLRALRLISQETSHCLAITAAQFTVTCCIEVQTVGTVGATVGRNDLTGVEGQRKFVDLLLATDADTLSVCLHDVSGIEVHLFRFQLKVSAKVVIDLLHHTCPLRVTRIGFTLMHQDALDDTVLLRFFGQCYQTLIRIVVVCLEHTFHPLRGSLDVTRDAVGQESFDVDTTDGNMDNTNLDVLRKRSHQRAAKPVGRSQTSVGTAERRYSLAPLPHFPASLRVINRRHEQEARSGTYKILSLRSRISLHVGLSETKENVEVLIYGSISRHTDEHHHSNE